MRGSIIMWLWYDIKRYFNIRYKSIISIGYDNLNQVGIDQEGLSIGDMIPYHNVIREIVKKDDVCRILMAKKLS